MNFSNQLTISRFFLTIIFVVIISSSWQWSATIALGIFGLASFTDWLDGYIARRYELCTNFGRLMDPLVDKILVAAALICLIPLHALPAWVVTVIISREFLITGLRLLAGEQGVVISADILGKHKTIWQLATVLFYLVLLASKDFYNKSPLWIPWLWETAGPLLIGITLILTVSSGISYLWKNRRLLRD